MKTKIDKSKVMKLAHKIAKSSTGNYAVRLSEAMKIVWKYFTTDYMKLKSNLDRTKYFLLDNFIKRFKELNIVIDNTDYSPFYS
jgi:hypothetical protein